MGEQKYFVRLVDDGVHSLAENGAYSMFGFIAWTEKKEHAKKYTKEQAEKLIREIPAHMGVGEMVAVTEWTKRTAGRLVRLADYPCFKNKKGVQF